MNTTLNQKDIILTVFCNNPFQIHISFNINQIEVARKIFHLNEESKWCAP